MRWSKGFGCKIKEKWELKDGVIDKKGKERLPATDRRLSVKTSYCVQGTLVKISVTDKEKWSQINPIIIVQ